MTVAFTQKQTEADEVRTAAKQSGFSSAITKSCGVEMINWREKRNPPRVILSEESNSQRAAKCFRFELSKICNELLIFESQNAVSVLRIYEGASCS